MRLINKTWFIVLMILILPPIGLFLMWRYRPYWNGWAKSFASIIIVLILIGNLSNSFADKTPQLETVDFSTDITTETFEVIPTTVVKTIPPTVIPETNTTAVISEMEYNNVSSMKVHFLDVGQGSATLFEIGDKIMIIDGGDCDKSSFVVAYLKKLGIQQIDVLIATHYDADHLNGLVGVLNVFPVLQVFDANYITDSRVYNSFKSIIKEKAIPELIPGMKQSIMVGDAKVTFIAPRNYGHSCANDDSICVRVELGQTSFIIMGDPSADAEQQILSQNLKSDVFIASHHGSNGSNSKTLLANVNPSFVVISCGENNPYGHPGDNTLSRIKNTAAELYRTDIQGTIICCSNGYELSWDKEPCNDFTPGEAITSETTSPASSMTTSVSPQNANGPQAYVLNTSTKKFHFPYCFSATQISDKNRKDVFLSRQEIIDQGYVPCKNCNP